MSNTFSRLVSRLRNNRTHPKGAVAQAARQVVFPVSAQSIRYQASEYVEALENRVLLSTVPSVTTVGDVFVIAMENHNFTQPSPASTPQQILGNVAAPYLNSLLTPGNPNAAQSSYSTAYYSTGIHPSEPNYIWAEAGSNLGVTADNDPTVANNNLFTGVTTLTDQMDAAGITWKNYQEDLQYSSSPAISASGSGTVANAYNGSTQYSYAAKHNPMAFFTDSQNKNVYQLAQLQTDLTNNTVGQYNWITPDLFNDMHTALNGGFTYKGTQYTGDQAAIAQGDHFLSIIVPAIEASQAYKNNGTIVIWGDESEGGDSTSYTIPEIVISPLARGNGYASNVPMSHSSDIKTWEQHFNLGAALNSTVASANDLSSLFQPTLPTGSVWNNLSSASPSWNVAANWTPSTSYPSTSIDSANLNVNVTVNESISLGTNLSVHSLTLGDSTLSSGSGQSETISGNNTLTFDNGSSAARLTMPANVVAGATIAAPISLASNLTIENDSSQTLTISGAIAMNGHSITVVGAGNVVLSGAVSSTSPATLVNQGSGTLTLSGSGDNSYLVLDAEAGTTILAKTGSSSAHAVANISNIASGATVKLAGTGGDQIFNGVSGYPGGVVMGGGTLDLAGSSETFDTLNGSGTVTNSSSTASTLTLGSASGSGTFSGAIQGGSGSPLTLVKIGSGTLTLSGASDNSYLVLDAEAGTTILAKTGSGGAHAVARISNIASGTTVKLAGTGGDQIFNGVSGYPGGVVMGGGTLDLAGTSETFDTLTGSGTVTNSSSAASTLTLGSANGSGTFSGTIHGGSGTLTLLKIGSGTLTLSGAGDNSYLVLDAEAGTTILAKTASGSAHAVARISNIASGATVKLAGTGGDQIFNGVSGYPGGVVMGGGTLDLAGTSETFDTLNGSGAVTNSSSTASTLTLGSANGSGSFSGTIQSGSGTLTLLKIGSGTEIINGKPLT